MVSYDDVNDRRAGNPGTRQVVYPSTLGFEPSTMNTVRGKTLLIVLPPGNINEQPK
jgi:hypothetical protein